MFSTQNSILHKRKVQCEVVRKGQLSVLSLWISPDHISLQNYTIANNTQHKHNMQMQENKSRETRAKKRDPKTKGREQQESTFPWVGSCTFQNTYVSITSIPPSLAFCIRSSHIYHNPTFLKKIRYQTKHIQLSKERKACEILAYIRSASWVVDGTREKNSSLAIYHKCLPIISHTTLDQLSTTQKHSQEHQSTQLGNGVSSHFCFPSFL